MDDTTRLTRRKLLAGTGAIGAGLAVGGSGAFALLSDSETSEDNAVTAGTLDLELDWVKYYHGRDFHTDVQAPTSNPGPIFELGDVKPGDCGGGGVSVHVGGNPAYVYATLDVTGNSEGDIEEPERDSSDEDGTEVGELAENVHVVAKPAGYLPGSNPSEKLETYRDQFVRESCPDGGDFDESDCYFVGTLPAVADATEDGYLLDGGLSPLNSPDETAPFVADSTYLVDFVWWIPDAVGNEIQDDGVTFDLTFTAVQSRHLDDPEDYDL